MLLNDIKNIKSTKKDLRNFGLSVGGVLALLGLILLWYARPAYPYFIIVGAALIALGLVYPAILKPPQKAWMALAVVMGFVMTRVILSLLFFVVFTLFHAIAKVVGKKFLDASIDKNAATYWKKRDPAREKASNPERQF